MFGTRAKKERRPAGVSRRRKRKLGFESLEARQVMSASAIVPQYNLASEGGMATISTATVQGQLDALAREMWWYSQMPSASSTGTALVVNSLPTDPLFQNQWHLLNTGQNVGNDDFQPIFGVPGEDINVMGAWNLGYTGAGVKVAVIDTGVQLNHPDLAANIDLGLSFDALNHAGNGNPFFFDPTNAHGTAVAGLIGAVANNGIGGTGVAPGVTLVPIRLVDGLGGVGNLVVPDQSIVDAFRHTIFNDIDITNNSWGPPIPRALVGPSLTQFLALRDSIIYGRDGKGVIHVFSAGNNGGPVFNEGWLPLGGYDSSGYNGFLNSRYTIGVTGVDHDGFYNNEDGTITAYPEVSAAILVAAPTGSNAGPVIANDLGLGSGLWTTDLTGEFGFNVAPNTTNGQETEDPFYPFDRDFLADTDYTSRMNGTSASSPQVSGVIALMLEANPELTWRDVQEILVRSARMNAPTGVPTDAQNQGTQNTWIVNQVPIFHDLDFDPANPVVNPFQQIWFPTLDPNFVGALTWAAGTNSFHPDHHVATPIAMTNGAGYTVSQGYGSHFEQIGYGHGVVDAELAVRMAEQWHTKNQALPPELSFTSFVQAEGLDLHPAQQGNIRTGFIIVPGGIGGDPNFIALYNELFADTPNFNQDFDPRGASAVEFFVPDNQTMSIENVELKISIAGGTAAALDNLRIVLISPDGTHSEMNHFWIGDKPVNSGMQAFAASNPGIPMGSPGSTDTTPGQNLVWTFRSVRHWGERSDDAIVYDPRTGMPVIDQTGIWENNIIDPNTGLLVLEPGKAMTQGWRVVIENWSNADLDLDGLELAWHGSPIDAATERISGAIGVDEDGNDLFNFSRVIRVSDGPEFGDVLNIVDVNQEDFAENITVVARRASDNQVVDRFVTGHDGNFYFDLVPDEYIISIEDPEGRVALDDSLTTPGLLQHYKTEWRITPEHFKVWQKIGVTETPVDADGVPLPWLDANGEEQVYGVKGINFLLDPGEQPLDQVSFSGTVYADTNGDGAFNSNDVVLPNVTVYVDLNRNGAFDSGEVSVQTDAAGNYTVLQTGVTAAAVMNVGIVPPAQWTTTNPGDGLHTQFVLPGEVYGNLDFFIDPPANNIGGGGVDQPGILLGTAFEDLNADGVRNGLEVGAEDVTVYIDVNNNGTREASETSTQTNQFGAYAFTNLAPGEHIIRIDIASPLVQTTPAAGQPWVVNLTGSSTISTLHFGIFDLAVDDYGDLPNSYEMRPDGAGGFIFDPAHHKKGKYRLGTIVDGELTNAPSANADGDDLADNDVLADIDDEDGVVFFDPISAGDSARLLVTANNYTSYLQGWVDWNNDGDFLDEGERIVTDQLLVAGQQFISYNVPANVTATNVYARFRLGEHSTHPTTGAKRAIDTPFGLAATGEVEDYYVPVAFPAASLIVGIPADFDQDDDVDGNDFLTWQRNLGATTGATQAEGSADGDGDVDWADLQVWKNDFGTTGSAAAAATTGSQGNAAMGGSALTSIALAGAGLPSPNLGNQLASDLNSSTSASDSSSTVGSNTAAKSTASSRPALSALAGRVSEVADRLREASDRAKDRAGVVGEAVSDAVAEVADVVESFDFDSLRRDRAFDDLFGSRRRRQIVAELEFELTEDVGADEAFAALADHFEWRRD